MPMARHDECDELSFVPDKLRGKRFGKEPHAYSSDVTKFSVRITLGRNGQITLPLEVRRRMRASEGDVFVAEVRNPDEIVLRKKSLVDASQTYFWTDEWQQGERETQEDMRRGRVKRVRSAKALISDLKR
jgi:AbrB family looped-hinge helix DNA binding protein